MKLTRFVNPDTPMSQDLRDALNVFSAACMADGDIEITPEDAVSFLTEWGGAALAEQFKPECLFPALPPAP